MRKQIRNWWIGLCGVFAALGLMLGIWTSVPVYADAAAGVPTLTMDLGASVRKEPGDPGLKFKATIENWDKSYDYGMLIIPASAWDRYDWWGKNIDYVKTLQEMNLTAGKDFIQSKCPAFTAKDGTTKIALAMTEINEDNYAEEFVGVGYAVKDGQYIYAPVNEMDNARSVTFVAQKALQYEANKTSKEEELVLRTYANPGMEIGEDTYFTDDDMVIGDGTLVTPANYALQYTFNINGEQVSLITKKAYAGGTTVSFKYYIPAGTPTSWWGMAWHTDASKANIYHAAGIENAIGYQALGNVTGTWTDVSFTLPAGGPYYLYLGSEVSTTNWKIDGENSYALIDNFTINGEVADFGADISTSIFNVLGAGIHSYELQKGSIAFDTYVEEEVIENDYMLAFNGAAIGGSEDIAMITDKAYKGVSEITFKAIWTGEAESARWGVSYTTDPTKFSYGDGVDTLNCYTPKLGELKMDVGVAYTYKLTFANGSYTLYANGEQIGSGSYTDGANYFYFMVCPAVKGGMAFYMDDFSITYEDGTLVDTFAEAQSTLFVESSSKNVHHGSSGMSMEVSVFEESEGEDTPEATEKELALKILFNNSNDGVRVRTREAYAGGSTIEFKYFIQADQKTQWTRFIWDADTTCDNYGDPYTSFGNTAGKWVTWSYTLPEGGPYYLYFGFECGNWKDSSGAPYILIDDFTVNGEVETFNNGVKNSIFAILQSSLAMDSADGEGWMPLSGSFGAKIYGDKISSTKTTPTFITKQAYTFSEPTIVSFDYFMSGNTNNKWWILGWTNNQKVADIYAHVGSNKENNNGLDLPTGIQDVWSVASVEVPAGTWYFYIAMAKGEWSGGHVIVDNFRIGNIYTETFNGGIDESIFTVSPFSSHHSAIELAEGKEDFAPGAYSAKLDFTDSFGINAKTFITKNAYAGGSTVSFQYMIPEETTVGDWWAICWTTNASSPDFWAVGNGAASGCGGVNPNPNKHKGQGWVDFSVTLPNDGNMYYLYIVGYQNWKGCIYVDNFQVKSSTGKVVDDFTNGYGELGLFSVNGMYVGLGEDCQTSVGEEVVVGDPNALEYLLESGTIVDYLTNGGYGAFLQSATSVAINKDKLPASSLLLEGFVEYQMEGNKEFALYFGNGSFLFVSGEKIALYNGTELIKEFSYATAADATLRFTVTVGGKVIVKVENTFVGLGKMTEDVTEVKLVALGGEGVVTFGDIEIDTYYCKLDGAPIYLSNETIDFTAYAFDSDAMVSEAGFQLLAEAGFTKTLALLQGRCVGDLHEQNIPNEEHVKTLMAEVNKDALAALTLAEKYGMKHYVLNSNLYNLERNPNNYKWADLFAELATYTMSEAFAGHFLADEPQSAYNVLTGNELKELVNAYKAYRKAFPQGEAFINLLPRSATQFISDSYYINYVDYYIENIALGEDGTGYVSFDHYPLENKGITSVHLRNLEIIAERCRDNNLELRTYIKASTSGDSERSLRATESVNDLYMQIYSALAYGSKEIIYYQFTDHTTTDGTAGDGIISGTSLEKGNVYNWTKQANNEVKTFGAAYMNFTWKSVSVFGKTSITQFNNLKSKASAYGYLTGVESSASVLVGNFDDADNAYSYGAKNAYMVVNYGNTDNMTHATSEIKLTFNGNLNKVLVYENGKATVMDLTGNQLTLNLEIGEGAFVIPFSK